VAVHRHPGGKSEVNAREAAELSLETATGECTRGVCDGSLCRLDWERALFHVAKKMGERRSCNMGMTYLADILIVERVVVGCGYKLTLSSPNIKIGIRYITYLFLASCRDRIVMV